MSKKATLNPEQLTFVVQTEGLPYTDTDDRICYRVIGGGKCCITTENTPMLKGTVRQVCGQPVDTYEAGGLVNLYVPDVAAAIVIEAAKRGRHAQFVGVGRLLKRKDSLKDINDTICVDGRFVGEWTVYEFCTGNELGHGEFRFDDAKVKDPYIGVGEVIGLDWFPIASNTLSLAEAKRQLRGEPTEAEAAEEKTAKLADVAANGPKKHDRRKAPIEAGAELF